MFRNTGGANFNIKWSIHPHYRKRHCNFSLRHMKPHTEFFIRPDFEPPVSTSLRLTVGQVLPPVALPVKLSELTQHNVYQPPQHGCYCSHLCLCVSTSTEWSCTVIMATESASVLMGVTAGVIAP